MNEDKCPTCGEQMISYYKPEADFINPRTGEVRTHMKFEGYHCKKCGYKTYTEEIPKEEVV
jgi:predicted RNA-binding Zn-ribbon protein involved in translation (DUF1610 family)